MEDEQKEQPTPVRSRLKLYKILTVTLFFIVLFFLAGGVTVETTSSSKFCSSCHEMSPEYYTWKASSHNEVECKSCHIQSGVVNYAKAKMNGLVQVYEKTTGRYTAPIQMPTEIPNATCDRCHNMKSRQVTPSGDLIIPHDKHLNKGMKCVQCHSGVAHGNISDRNVTYKSDYSKWDAHLGKVMMSDVKFTAPKMEDCIKCHEARQISVSCKTCHSTGMKPKSHDAANFKTKAHGIQAEKDIKKCNSCHQYMSDNEIKGLQTKTAAQQFLSNGTLKDSTISAQAYAKENTFCQKCHGQRPASHGTSFIDAHGSIAKTDKQKCLTCHSEQRFSSGTSNGLASNEVPVATSGSAPACSSCHPANHAGKDFKSHHPINISSVTKPSARCYTCHIESQCTACHREGTPRKTTAKLNNKS